MYAFFSGTSVRAQLASEGPSYANVSVRDGRLLRLSTESVNAQTVLEIGTSIGESAVWFALALERTGGHLYTHEINKERARIARENFKKAGLEDLITLVEGDAHETVLQYEEPIDIVFMDADKPGGLIIAQNMNYLRPDPQSIKAITQNPELETAFLLMDGAGIGVTMKKR